jgi:hypothetical protein
VRALYQFRGFINVLPDPSVDTIPDLAKNAITSSSSSYNDDACANSLMSPYLSPAGGIVDQTVRAVLLSAPPSNPVDAGQRRAAPTSPSRQNGSGLAASRPFAVTRTVMLPKLLQPVPTVLPSSATNLPRGSSDLSDPGQVGTIPDLTFGVGEDG